MLAGAGVIFGLALLAPEILWPIAAIAMNSMIGLAAGGVAMEAGAIADALTSNRGQEITTRTPAGLRQIVYGAQRLGGTAVYQSTTGAGGAVGNYVYNYIIPIATHEIDAYLNVYLDGRRVYWKQNGNAANIGCGSVATPPTCAVTLSGTAVSAIAATGGSGFAAVKPARYRVRIKGGGGSGAAAYATLAGSTWTVHVTAGGTGYTSTPMVDIQGAYTFGGVGAADEQDPSQPGYGAGYGIGPDGQHYNFSGKVFCEARFGDQVAGDYMASLHANDIVWPSTARGAGVAYLYLNVGYDKTNFQNPPEIRVNVNGKNDIYDPRTGLSGYTMNWALQVADVIADRALGLGDGPVSGWPTNAIDQLIAAANVCDELVMTSQGNEARYAQAIHYDTSTSPGDALALMMPTAAGRISRVGGGWLIFPAYWQGPSFSFDESALVDTVSWTPNRSFKDLFNRVNGTYVAPNFPYNCAGNLYDANGWYYGSLSNVWPLAWQPTNFPQYAVDVLHGYSADQYLIEDGGIVLPKELTLRGCISIVQAQRVAKITLLRNRFQGSGVFPMQLAAWQMQPVDVMQFSFPLLGWVNKYLEIDGDPAMQFVCEEDKSGGDDGGGSNSGGQAKVMKLSVVAMVRETDPSIYAWSTVEELTPYDVPAAPQQIPPTPAPPTSFTVTSSAATAVIGADGSVIPRALLSWSAPLDITVRNVQMQYQLSGAGAWLDGGTVDVALFEAFVGPLIGGSTYNFRIRSARAGLVDSAWVEIDGEVISITLSSTSTTGSTVAPPGTLTAQGLVGGTANITVFPFTASVGGLSIACLTAGPYTITGLAQSQLYYVYYIDPTFAGGAITPIATTNTADYLAHVGYFLIGSIVTPSYSPRYQPTAYNDLGSSATIAPTAAYDNNLISAAAVLGRWWTVAAPGPVFSYVGANGDCVWYGFPNITTVAATTLYVVASAGASGTGPFAGSIVATIAGTPTTMASFTVTTAQTVYTLTVPSGTNLSTISIEVTASATVGGSPGGGSIAVSEVEIYIQ